MCYYGHYHVFALSDCQITSTNSGGSNPHSCHSGYQELPIMANKYAHWFNHGIHAHLYVWHFTWGATHSTWRADVCNSLLSIVPRAELPFRIERPDHYGALFPLMQGKMHSQSHLTVYEVILGVDSSFPSIILTELDNCYPHTHTKEDRINRFAITSSESNVFMCMAV